jgi:hypothetical protein
MTVGPWRPITLHTYTTRLSDVWIRSSVDAEGVGKLSVDIELNEKVSATANVVLDSVFSKEMKVIDGKGKLEIELKKGEIELWYPIGYGTQKLYDVKVEVIQVLIFESSYLAHADTAVYRMVRCWIAVQSSTVSEPFVSFRNHLSTNLASPSCLKLMVSVFSVVDQTGFLQTHSSQRMYQHSVLQGVILTEG